ncbi:LCP family protein [Kutzneria kofuensis]|uniref:LCP family protein required for cell wall assembly n=1 Tax=Kutzneria kofuensis TaxID=103725 RepID=A0A7W9NEU3_9PSEU|nr:LCP family protein [Kutzneria kofuensis]MBB5889313.1 LCP family protein required for cell wall assembly [Kutzneria kofuensis]
MPERVDVRRVPPRPAGRPRPAARRRPSPALRTVQVLMVVVSMVVFGGTWYAWSQLAQLNGLTTANVIGKTVSPLAEQNILMVGLDTRTDAMGNPLPKDVLNQLHAGGGDDGGDTTDTMIVIHIPAGGGAATAISIPRDSYVQIADGFGKHKINSAYSYGRNDAYSTLSKQGLSGADLETKAAEAGAKTSIATIEQFTGLQITHYAAVNLAGFYFISQAIGGVPVCLVAPVKDSFSGANFPAGQQTVEGSAALAFVRQRHGLPNGDLDRIKRQQAFMSSMAKTVLSAGTLANPGKLNDLIGAVKKAVVIDQGWDVLQFAQQLQGMSTGNIKFVTIPIVSITLQTPHDGDAVQVDPAQVQEFVKQTIGGAASGSASPTGAASPNSVDYSSTTVDVRNASGVAGLAGSVEEKLVGKGFGRGDTGNATARKASSVNYPSGGKAAAQAVATALGGLPLVPDDSITAGHVRVYVGTDYNTKYGFTGNAPMQLNTFAAAAPSTTSSNSAITADGVPCIN